MAVFPKWGNGLSCPIHTGETVLTHQTIITGQQFAQLVERGAKHFKENLKEINDLNVFPIPDGDTGDNMYMTLCGGLQSLQQTASTSISAKAEGMAKGMLLSARGNSGVIFSQLFAGLSKGLEGLEQATLQQFCQALTCAVQQAYTAVSQPVEGTMLTVARETAESANQLCTSVESMEQFASQCFQAMNVSLKNTPNLLPVLKEAGVVDSGGAGLLYFVEGMLPTTQLHEEAVSSVATVAQQLDFSKFTKDSQMVFGYCTECLLQLQTCKVDVDAFDVATIVDYLETIGDSVVTFKTDTIVKLHVHTLKPYKVLKFCQQFGEFLTVKIENMTLQHNGLQKQEKKVKKHPHKKFGVVTVASGEGLSDVFKELGADIVIDGGQTKNPSVEDFVEAFETVNCDEIFVLPNNSNIIMAAQSAKDVYQKSVVHIIPTKDFGQAYSILSMLDFSCNNGQQIAQEMAETMQGVVTASITTAVRHTTLNGVEITAGHYIGFTGKKMRVCNQSKIGAVQDLLASLEMDDKNYVIAVYGKDATQSERQQTAQHVAQNYPNLEFYEVDGKQEVYDFILIIE